ncbi:LysR family transcriptional regulator [Paraburkholderia ferrariae]|uniref:LysR family transcriptional regulator n=1 Tax=Paraburkholderia ferrariae TaxID=386056 RepID=A0ABU9RQ07_9BURK
MQARREANIVSRPLEIDLLRSFAVIAEVRSISRAAERVGRTQSALSQQIKRLEEIVDQPLFQRTGRGDYAAVFLPSLLRRFSGQHPNALVEVVCVPTPRLLEQLDKRAVDLALVSLPLTAIGSANASGPHDEIIRREQLVWIGSPGLDSAHVDPLPLALSDPDTLDHIAACEALERMGRAYRVAYASSSLAGLTALVRSGQAFAVMTQTAVPADLAILNGDPALPPLPAVGITIKFGRKRPSLLTAAFAEHIRLTLPLL